MVPLYFLDHANIDLDTDYCVSRCYTYRAMDDLTLLYIGRLLHNARRTTPVTLLDSSPIKTLYPEHGIIFLWSIVTKLRSTIILYVMAAGVPVHTHYQRSCLISSTVSQEYVLLCVKVL